MVPVSTRAPRPKHFWWPIASGARSIPCRRIPRMTSPLNICGRRRNFPKANLNIYSSTAWIVVALLAILALPVSARAGKNTASEFLEQAIEEEMASSDILNLLTRNVGVIASSGTQPVTHQLRKGLFVTALPQGPNVLLRVEVTREDTEEREIIT
jgi:hypothetical protein